jgi:hypothetical protein
VVNLVTEVMNMNGEALGAYFVTAVLLFAVGTVAATSISHYDGEKDGAVQEAHLMGMVEMHNSMTGVELLPEEIIEMHESEMCPVISSSF